MSSPTTLAECLRLFGAEMAAKYGYSVGNYQHLAVVGGHGLALVISEDAMLDTDSKAYGLIYEFGSRCRHHSPARMYPWYRKKLLKLSGV